MRITLLSKLILINIGTEYRSVQTKEIHHITLGTALIWTYKFSRPFTFILGLAVGKNLFTLFR